MDCREAEGDMIKFTDTDGTQMNMAEIKVFGSALRGKLKIKGKFGCRVNLTPVIYYI